MSSHHKRSNTRLIYLLWVRGGFGPSKGWIQWCQSWRALTTISKGTECIPKVSCTIRVRWRCSIASADRTNRKTRAGSYSVELHNCDIKKKKQNNTPSGPSLPFHTNPLLSHRFLGSLHSYQPPFLFVLQVSYSRISKTSPLPQTLLSLAYSSLLPSLPTPYWPFLHRVNLIINAAKFPKYISIEITPIHPIPYAAESLQSYLTLCNPIDGSLPGPPVRGILQARTLEWVAISLSNAWKWKVKVKSLSRVQLLATPWTAAHQAPLSMGFSRQEHWSGVPLPSPL